jgi:hypothetical protein
MSYSGYRTKNLLSVNADAKTVKGLKKGILTGILYLAPHDISGYQVCAMASKGCKAACIYSAGHGRYNNVQKSRINKTRWLMQERESFMAQLVKNIEALERKAYREGLIPTVRLNGTSDLPFEKYRVVRNGVTYRNIMRAFPGVQFYDYTKIHGRKFALAMPNYHLTFSLSEENDANAVKAINEGYNVAVVMRLGRNDPKPETWDGYPVIDGDENDARFLDPKGGHVVALFAKGDGIHDKSGFVRDPNGGFNINKRIKLKVA